MLVEARACALRFTVQSGARARQRSVLKRKSERGNPTFDTTGLRAIQHSVQPDCVQLSVGKHALASVFDNNM
jgi:hypothetical protein